MKQEHSKARSTRQEEQTEQAPADVTNAELAKKTQETLDSIEDALDAQLDEELLADIDDALEENAEEFVFNYIQAGGQ